MDRKGRGRPSSSSSSSSTSFNSSSSSSSSISFNSSSSSRAADALSVRSIYAPGLAAGAPQQPQQQLPQRNQGQGFRSNSSSSSSNSSSSSSSSSSIPSSSSLALADEGLKGLTGHRAKKPRTAGPTLTAAQLTAMSDDEQMLAAIRLSLQTQQPIEGKITSFDPDDDRMVDEGEGEGKQGGQGSSAPAAGSAPGAQRAAVSVSDVLASEATQNTKPYDIEVVICHGEKVLGTIPGEKCDNSELIELLVADVKINYLKQLPTNSTVFIVMSEFNDEKEQSQIDALMRSLALSITVKLASASSLMSDKQELVKITNLEKVDKPVPKDSKQQEAKASKKPTDLMASNRKRKRDEDEETIEEKDKKHFYYLRVKGTRATHDALATFQKIMSDPAINISKNKPSVRAPLTSSDFRKALGDDTSENKKLASYMHELARGTELIPKKDTLDLWSFMSLMNWLSAKYLLSVAAAKIAHLMRDVPNEGLFEVFFGTEPSQELKDAKEKSEQKTGKLPSGKLPSSSSSSSSSSELAPSKLTSSSTRSERSEKLTSSSTRSERSERRPKRRRDTREGEGEGEGD